MKIDLNVIACESGKTGEILCGLLLESIEDAFDEVVVVDNGCDERVRQTFEDYAKEHGNLTLIDKKEVKNYSQLRNVALDHSKKTKADWVVWHDCDDVVYADNYHSLRETVLGDKNITNVTQSFRHFMGSPFTIQNDRDYAKNNIFKLSPDVKWGGDVHETLLGVDVKKGCRINNYYMHFGYALKPAFQIFLRWLLYDYIEKGSVDGYSKEKGTWCYSDGNPQEILHDRFASGLASQYHGLYPSAMISLVQNNMRDFYYDSDMSPLANTERFQKMWVQEYDDGFLSKWQKYKEQKQCQWQETYAWALAEYFNMEGVV